MEPRIDVHLLTLNEPAEWRETCIASLEGAPIQLYVLPGIPGRIGEARAAGYAQGTLPLVPSSEQSDYFCSEEWLGRASWPAQPVPIPGTELPFCRSCDCDQRSRRPTPTRSDSPLLTE